MIYTQLFRIRSAFEPESSGTLRDVRTNTHTYKTRTWTQRHIGRGTRIRENLLVHMYIRNHLTWNIGDTVLLDHYTPRRFHMEYGIGGAPRCVSMKYARLGFRYTRRECVKTTARI